MSPLSRRHLRHSRDTLTTIWKLGLSQRNFVLQEQPCHHRNDRQVVKATFGMRLNLLMRLTSFLGICHNLCSEFVLGTTFRNSMKIALNFIVNINQMHNNNEYLF